MNSQKLQKTRKKKATLLLTLLLISLFPIFLLNFSNFEQSTEDLSEEDDNFTNIENLKTSILGNATWWDKSYRSRQLINITNPYSVNFENYGVSITFNYTKLINQGQMNSSLKDVRIIEYDSEGNPFMRKYYFKMNYPQTEIATVWFDTNISASTTEHDTYIYYGKEEAEIDDEGHYFMDIASNSLADSLGWVRNGNFELDIKSGTLINGLFGWNWTDDVPEDVGPGYDPNVPGANYQHNLSNYVGQHEDVYEGQYSFKAGVTDHYLPSEGSSNEFIGTLYSYPFIVPKISGAGSPKLYIQAWRNVRLYDLSNPRWMEFYARTSKDYSQTMDTGHNGLPDGLAEDWISIGDSKGPEYTAENQLDLSQANTYIGELMDVIYLDVTNHQGELIFLEFGMWGVEGDKVSAFSQVDDVRFNFTLTTALNPEIEERRSDITIITRDVDGRLIPNAKVSLVNISLPEPIIETKFTSMEDASVTFSGVGFGEYNFTVNYTLPSGKEEVMYNSYESGEGPFDIQQAIENETLYIYMWTIDFEIVDFGKEEPLTMGNITIRDPLAADEFLTNLTLNDEGKATFRWKNQSMYYYKIWYDNDDYNLNPTALNASYILRDTYDQLNNKYKTTSVSINATNTASGPNFEVSELFYTNGSRTELGNKKIIKANVTITVPEPGSTLTSVSIYYIDKYNSTDGNLIYYNESYTSSDKINLIKIDIRDPLIMSSNLKGDKFEAYGLKIIAIGENSSRCDGIIKVDLIETCNIYNVTDLCEVNIKVIGTDYSGVAGCYIKVNSTNRDGTLYVDLLTKDLTGDAYGQINTDIPLWYLRGYNYSFSLEFFGEHQSLIVNQSDKWMPSGPRYAYNYRLNQTADLIFQLYLSGGVNTSWYQTRFKDLTMVEQVIWGEDITVSVNFTLTTDNWQTSSATDPPATVKCTIKSTGIGAKVWLTLDMDPGIGAGIYTATFDSSLLSAGNTGKIYSFIISGIKSGYTPPTNVSETILISTVPTNLTMHDYVSLNEISEISQTFGEFVNLTIKYYDTNSPLKGATLTYEWLYLDPIQFYEDPIKEGYYITTIDTSLAELWGLKSIEIIAKLENHTTQSFLTSLSITERMTTLNEETDLVYISSKVWVEDPNPFEFIYQDEITEDYIGNLTTATYTWEELYKNGSRIPGVHGSGTLIQNGNNTHILDFNTELKSVGYYYLYITLQKQNYKARSALINLEIMLREFVPTIGDPQLGSNNQIQIEHGTDIDFEISLWDDSRNMELQNATIKFNFRGVNHTFDPSDATAGLYTLRLLTSNIDTFLTARTFVGKIYIEAANFTKQEITITVTVKMEEIFPGMPSFYFILITASIIGILGSAVAYRVIQQARIPKHVKKIRKVKGLIKSKKKIEELISIPSKEQMIAKLFGNDWKEIGLSLDETLGIQDLKSKKLSLKNKISKEGGVD